MFSIVCVLVATRYVYAMTLRRLFFVPSLALALSLSACAPSSEAQTSSDEAHRIVAAGATLLDVRTPAEYGGRHIEGAVNIPVDEVRARLSEIPRDKPVVVYCQSGGRSAAAASTLREAGYEVHDLGPIDAW